MGVDSNKFWQNKRVAVTGASGFLGGHFVEELKKRGGLVSPLSKEKVDLLNQKAACKALENIEVLINCAAIDGNAEFKKKHPAEILDSNIRITSNILNSAKENKIGDVVLISSSEIYSSYAPNPIKEQDDYRLYGGHTSNGYILSKRYGEILADLYAEQYGLRVYMPRPTNIYGPGDHFGDSSTRVIPSFISKIFSKNSIEIWGDGSQSRQFVFVRDVVNYVLYTVEHQIVGPVNISSEEAISVLELAKKISGLMEIKADIKLDLSKSSGTKDRHLDISKIIGLVGSHPISLDDGLRETIDWYKKIFSR